MAEDSKVVALSDFQSRAGDEATKVIEGSGVVLSYNPAFEALEIPDPVPGEIVIGVLTEDEVGLYVEYHNLFVEWDTAVTELNVSLLSEAAASLQAGSNDLSDFQRTMEGLIDDDEAERLSRIRRRIELMRSALFWSIGERLETHRHVLGVRSNGRIIRRINGGR